MGEFPLQNLRGFLFPQKNKKEINAKNDLQKSNYHGKVKKSIIFMDTLESLQFKKRRRCTAKKRWTYAFLLISQAKGQSISKKCKCSTL